MGDATEIRPPDRADRKKSTIKPPRRKRGSKPPSGDDSRPLLTWEHDSLDSSQQPVGSALGHPLDLVEDLDLLVDLGPLTPVALVLWGTEILDGYQHLRDTAPAMHRFFEDAAQAGQAARAEVPLSLLLPPELGFVAREQVLALIPMLVDATGPRPGAELPLAAMAENEALRRFLADRLDQTVTIDLDEAASRLRFSVGGFSLRDDGTGALGLEPLDPIATVPFAQLLADEIIAIEQLIAIEDLVRRAQVAATEAAPRASDVLAAPERYAYNDVEALHQSVVAVANLAAPALGQLHPSNEDQRSRLQVSAAQLGTARALAESAWARINEFQRDHLPDSTAGELYDEAASEQYAQGGLHNVSGFLYDVWHVAGQMTTFGSMGRRAENARAYREGRISWDAYEENERWDLLASAVTAVITGLSLGLGARLAAGRFGVAAGYTATGSAVMTGTVVGGATATAIAMSDDAVAVLAGHVSDNPYVRAYQSSRIGGPAYWLTSGLFGAMAGGILGGLFAKVGGWLGLGRVGGSVAGATADDFALAAASDDPIAALPASARARLAHVEEALAAKDIHRAIGLMDDLRGVIPDDALRARIEAQVAAKLQITSPAVYRNPRAILPSGEEVAPTAHGGRLYYGTDSVPPDVAFARGLEARGANLKLESHVMGEADTAFRGATEQILTPEGQGAGAWAGEGGWVYRIDRVPSWNVNQLLEGRIRTPGGFRGNLMAGEGESAILANVPKERIVEAYPIILRGGVLRPGEPIKNPNYIPHGGNR